MPVSVDGDLRGDWFGGGGGRSVGYSEDVMAEDDIKISICEACFAVDEANYHYCKHCGTPSKYRKRLDRRNERRQKAKSSTATIILSTIDENEAFIAKAVEIGFYEYVNE